jgi:tetratricopeptide (TPR) repeat protein
VGIRSILLVAVLALAAPPLFAADPFYLDLMRDGTHAFDRGDYATAARYLRLACFGMLDEPKTLGECLARQALAQDKEGNVAGFRETFGRLVEVEERFQGYSQSSLPPEIRTALAQRMAALIPAPTLAVSPQALRGAGRKPDAPAIQTTPQKTTQATRPPAAKPQSDPPQPIERSATPPSTQPTAPPPPVPAAAPAPREPTSAEKKQLEKARKLLAETGNIRQLREAFQLAREVADAHPESRETQQLTGEAAYRISRWSEAADYLGRAGGPGDDQPELLFYLAVALYESGASQAAAAPLRRALPNLQRTPYVDGYAKKILGQ